jgi:ribosomal protein S14
MRILYTKDKNRRNIFSRLEKKRTVLNYILKNTNLNKDIREHAFLQLRLLFFKGAAITKIKNRCVLSNRSRAVYRKFKLSRIFFKQYALQGLIMGAKKAS